MGFTNLLRNGPLEGNWSEQKNHRCLVFPIGGASYERVKENIFTPPHYLVWFVHQAGLWDEFEGTDAWGSLDPNRAHNYKDGSGVKGYRLFTKNRTHDGGLMQTVYGNFKAGEVLRFTAYAHAWSNHKPIPGHAKSAQASGDGRWSFGFGRDKAIFYYENDLPYVDYSKITEPEKAWYDARDNFTFWLGIDPLGGNNPFVDSVVWGRGAHIYNTYSAVPACEVVLQQDTNQVAVFTRSKTRWAFTNNDAYWDDLCLQKIQGNYPIGNREPPVTFYISDSTAVVQAPAPLGNVELTSGTLLYNCVGMTRTHDRWWSWQFDLGDDTSQETKRIISANEITPRTFGLSVPIPPPSSEDEITLHLQTDVQRVGDVVLATAVSDTELSNVQFSLTIADQDFPVEMVDSWVSEGQWFWETEFTVNDEGLHSLSVESDTCSDDVSFEVLPDVSERGKPRVQYKRTYVLMHKDHTADQVKRVIAASYNSGFRYTVGQSADDMCIGDLDSRNGIIVEASKWGGEKALIDWVAEWYPGVNLTFVDSVEQFERLMGVPQPTPPFDLLVGLHDEAGGKWMITNGISNGVCLVHRQVQTSHIELDYTHLQSAGQTVICRLNWGYADGTGTLPPFDERLEAHIIALAKTMNDAKGVDYFHFANEPNNRSEWPAGSIITVEQVIYAYNKLCGLLGGHVKIGPPPLDPYFGPSSDNGHWWHSILSEIIRANAIFLHTGKTQTNDAGLVWSDAKFTHWPLQWQYLNARATDTYLEMIPERFRGLPIFITECNPQYINAVGGELGWKPDNAAWVAEMAQFARDREITGVVFYRFDKAGDQSGFGLADKPEILGQIAVESRR